MSESEHIYRDDKRYETYKKCETTHLNTQSRDECWSLKLMCVQTFMILFTFSTSPSSPTNSFSLSSLRISYAINILLHFISWFRKQYSRQLSHVSESWALFEMKPNGRTDKMTKMNGPERRKTVGKCRKFEKLFLSSLDFSSANIAIGAFRHVISDSFTFSCVCFECEKRTWKAHELHSNLWKIDKTFSRWAKLQIGLWSFGKIIRMNNV